MSLDEARSLIAQTRSSAQRAAAEQLLNEALALPNRPPEQRDAAVARIRQLDAEDDLLRLFDFLLENDVGAAERARAAIEEGIRLLAFSPFSCRKAEDNPLVRELLIPFGSAGHVALFEIEEAATVTILAVRHQREDDYH